MIAACSMALQSKHLSHCMSAACLVEARTLPACLPVCASLSHLNPDPPNRSHA